MTEDGKDMLDYYAGVERAVWRVGLCNALTAHSLKRDDNAADTLASRLMVDLLTLTDGDLRELLDIV